MTDIELITERAKAILRTEASVLRHWVEGLTAVDSANALDVSPATIEHLRRHLQLTRARGRGRTREVRLVVEVRTP